MLLEDHVVIAVVVEDRGRTELGGSTAGLGDGFRLHQMDLRNQARKGDWPPHSRVRTQQQGATSLLKANTWR